MLLNNKSYPYDVLGGSQKLFIYLSTFTPVGCVIWWNCRLHIYAYNIGVQDQCNKSVYLAINNYRWMDILHLTLQRQSTAGQLAPMVVQLSHSTGWRWVSPCSRGIGRSFHVDLWDRQRWNSKPHEQYQATDNDSILNSMITVAVIELCRLFYCRWKCTELCRLFVRG